MSEGFIPQMCPLFGSEERDAVAAYMDSGGFVTEFKKTEEFEDAIASFTGAKHCVVVNNGTISLTLAALALDIGPGDEVIVPNYTMIATPNSLKLIGAVPVFVDVNPNTLILDLNLVRQAITSETKGICLVLANGRYPSDGIEQFEELAEEFGLTLIEDAAQSLGSRYPDGRHIGRAGKIGSFSFSAPKIISTGQGGALITDDDDISNKLRRLKDFGRASGGNDLHDSIGFNFKFTDLQACVGLEQMKKLENRITRKKEIWSIYNELLEPQENVTLFDHSIEYTAPWFIDCLVKDREGLISFLKGKGVGSRAMYPPIHAQNCYGQDGSFPVSENIGEKGLWLPSYSHLLDSEIESVCASIAAFYK
ncbi:MAG: GDP-perosamine synthase [Nitrospirales bacterium]|nr:MAG: GDP-perosamine synthase [Nitrospirales bacterium]